MSIARVNPGTWSIGDKLTSDQQNDLDINVTYALDKRAAQTDTLESVVSLSGAGRIVPSVVTGANVDTSYLVSGGNLAIRVTSAVTANRTYTLSATDAVSGDVISVFCESSFVTYQVTIVDQASATMFTLGNLDSSDGTWAQFIYIGGWRLYQGSQGSRVRRQTFTANGTWTCPLGVTKALLIGVGAGGGGGAGGGSSGKLGSGGGGGGAVGGCVEVTVTPATAYTVTVGVGGAGGVGAGSANGGAGADGGNTTFDTLATFYGAGGGAGGGDNTKFSRGGPSAKHGAALTAGQSAIGERPLGGEGGWGNHSASATASYRTGGNSPVAAGGATGADFGTAVFGGGGGGASGFVGSVAGTGGDYTQVGVAGTLGAGGGGGGGGPGTGDPGPDGGAGGDGAVTVVWVK